MRAEDWPASPLHPLRTRDFLQWDAFDLATAYVLPIPTMAPHAHSRLPGAAAIAGDGRGFLYIAACSGPEDLLKVGCSHDPVERWSAFHRRWFEAFDLDRSLLVQTETRRDARVMETALHRQLREHNCPAPLSMRAQSGGATEWYRGAYDTVLAFALDAQRQGHVLHRPARDWLAAAMQARADTLASLLDHAVRSHAQGLLPTAQREAVLDLVDAHRAFDPDVGERLAAELRALRGG